MNLSEAEVARRRTADPPPATLRWVEACVGSRARVVAVRVLPGGYASAVHRVELDTAAGARESLVLKRFVRSDWLARDPSVPEREAFALELVRGLELPTPELVAVNARGEAGDHPALLMSALAGRVDLPEVASDDWVRRIARPLGVLYDFAPAARARLPGLSPFYDLEALEVPETSSVPELWERAIARVAGPRPDFEPRVVHRDYHPTNLLWEGPELSGVLDWTETCLGPAEIDLAHCRINLVQLYGVEVADAFREAWIETLDRRDAPPHPYWDLFLAVGWLPTSDLYPGWADLGFRGLTLDLVFARRDAYVASLLARLEEVEGSE